MSVKRALTRRGRLHVGDGAIFVMPYACSLRKILKTY